MRFSLDLLFQGSFLICDNGSPERNVTDRLGLLHGGKARFTSPVNSELMQPSVLSSKFCSMCPERLQLLSEMKVLIRHYLLDLFQKQVGITRLMQGARQLYQTMTPVKLMILPACMLILRDTYHKSPVLHLQNIKLFVQLLKRLKNSLFFLAIG